MVGGSVGSPGLKSGLGTVMVPMDSSVMIVSVENQLSGDRTNAKETHSIYLFRHDEMRDFKKDWKEAREQDPNYWDLMPALARMVHAGWSYEHITPMKVDL